MGTFEGLVRFDGVDFVTFDASNTPEFSINFPTSLMEDDSGNLWIGFYLGGLVRRTNGRFFRYSITEGLLTNQVWCIAKDRSGNILVGTEAGLNIVSGERVVDAITTADGLPSNDVRAILNDGSGGIFIGTARGLSHWSNGNFSNYSTANGLISDVIVSLVRTSDGALWIGTERGLNRFADGKFTAISLPGSERPVITKLLGGDDLWIGTETNGLYRIGPNSTEAEPAFTAPGNNWISEIYRDPDNALWVGSINGGLHRHRKDRFSMLSRSDGLSDDNVSAVIERSDGSLVFSTDKMLYRSMNGVFSEVLKTGPGGSIAEESGRLWVETPDGLVILGPNGRQVPTDDSGSPITKVRYVTAASNQTVWVGTWTGAYMFQEGRFVKRLTVEHGLGADVVNAVFEDSKGTVWFGTVMGLNRLENGRLTHFTTADGLPDDIINSFFETADGAIWIGTNGKGLVRYKDGHFRTVTSANGLYDNLAFVIVGDDYGHLWLCGNKGIYRAGLDQLNDFLDGKRHHIDSYSYDTADGLLNRECNQGSPTGFRRRNGEMMFATVEGLAIVDPAALDSRPPIVNIERLQVAGEPREMTDLLELSPGEDNVEIKYTGINWARPKQIRFKYKLEGQDNEWIDAGHRRTAYFSYIPPGDYTFRVIADNGEGIWNEEGKSIKIKVWPSFYRSLWFNVLSVAVFALIIFALYRRRIAQLERRRAEQQEFSRQLLASQERERKRIAAELHDSLGQSLAMIKNQAVFGSQAAKDLDAAKVQLEQISNQSAQAISEVREIAYNLRPYLLDRLGLTKAVKSMLGKIAEIGALKVEAEIDDIDGIFPAETEINVYRVLQESLNNILKHSEASKVIVSIRKNARMVTIGIEDNGRGFDVRRPKGDVHSTRADEKPGFGLLGISERVKMFGGTHTIESEIGKGTLITVNLKLPPLINGTDRQ
jgi:signal transduction histidine kinase/ligand-binding sensor domain-containing protein